MPRAGRKIVISTTLLLIFQKKYTTFANNNAFRIKQISLHFAFYTKHYSCGFVFRIKQIDQRQIQLRMETLFEKQDAMLRTTSMEIVRSFMSDINWEAPMLCIRGPRGVGKSTLLRQYVKLNYEPGSEAVLYCSMDWVYFSQHSMLEVAEKFYKKGGKLLIFDEAHKYSNWSREVKEIAEIYPDMQLFISGSSLLKLLDGDADLSRRCRGYDMPGLSFREFLHFYKGIEVESHSLKEILESPKTIATKVNAVCRPLQYFHEYLRFGYYPFYKTNPIDYYPLIEQTINYVVDVELPQQRGVNPSNCRRIKALLNVLASQVPFDIDISKIATAIGLQRNTVLEYMNHLKDAKIINLLYSDNASVKKMQKPDKVYLENPNLMYALADKQTDIGNVRETFFANQLRKNHQVNLSETSDFLIDGKYTFEVGGKDKGKKQIATLENAYIVADDIEYGMGNKIPLWLFGFLY